MFNFFVSSKPRPIHLDVAELYSSGTETLPAQFTGKTHDNREVYGRYRGGRLSIKVAKAPGVDPWDDGEVVFAEYLGVPYTRPLTEHDFCLMTGVTVNGQLPCSPEERPRECLDYSGRTTYFSGSTEMVTEETAREIIDVCHAAISGARLIEAITDEAYKCRYLVETDAAIAKLGQLFLVSGARSVADIQSDPEHYVLPTAGQDLVDLHCTNALGSLFGVCNPGDLEVVLADTGRAPVVLNAVVNRKKMGPNCKSFHIMAEFETADTRMRRDLETLAKNVEALLPERTLKVVDLATGHLVETCRRRVDPRIEDWCAASEAHWLGIAKDRTAGTWTAARPH